MKKEKIKEVRDMNKKYIIELIFKIILVGIMLLLLAMAIEESGKTVALGIGIMFCYYLLMILRGKIK